jgi:hypothetical protein
MNADNIRLQRYLRAQAATLALPPGDPTAVVARAANRRRRRRVVATSVTALALVAAAIGVQQLGGDDNGTGQLAAQPSTTVAANPLDWTVVQPHTGLGYSSSITVSDDGSIYGLSTAPGRANPGELPTRTALYRSQDGVEWSTVPLPDDLWPSQLASSGGALYAVGTSPATAGGRDLVLAKGDGSGSSWTQATLPLDVASLDRKYPGLVSVSGAEVTAGPHGVVAAVQVSAHLDPATVLPPGTEITGGFTWTADGLQLLAPIDVCAKDGNVAPCRERPTLANATVVATYTWAQLGIGDELRSLILGELHVFTSTDGEGFVEATLPEGLRGQGTLVSTKHGYVLFSQDNSDSGGTVSVVRSSDAQSWTLDASAQFDGYVVGAGTIGGRAAVITDKIGPVLHAEQADGTWSSLSIGDAIDVPAGSSVTAGVADIGPLGAAAVLTVSEMNGPGPFTQYVAFSPDGRSLTVVPIDWYRDGRYAGTIRVTADAVTVVLSPERTSPGDDPTSQLLVGTPR